MCGHVGEGIPLVEAPEDSKFQIVFPVVIGNENLSLILAAGWMSQPLEPTRLQLLVLLSHSVTQSLGVVVLFASLEDVWSN